MGIPDSTMMRADILASILQERVRQEQLKAQGKFQYTCADSEMTDDQRACVLVEEVGEVCRAVLVMSGLAFDKGKGDVEHLREELVQVAAVSMAWIEYIDRSVGKVAA